MPMSTIAILRNSFLSWLQSTMRSKRPNQHRRVGLIQIDPTIALGERIKKAGRLAPLQNTFPSAWFNNGNAPAYTGRRPAPRCSRPVPVTAW